MGAPLPKQYLKIDGRTILEMTVSAFAGHPDVDEICIVTDPVLADLMEGNESGTAGEAAGDKEGDFRTELKSLIHAAKAAGSKFAGITGGGSTRQESVQRALEYVAGLSAGISCSEDPVPEDHVTGAAMTEADGTKAAHHIVLIHDGARPFVSRQVIDNVLRMTCQTGAAVAAVPVKDTIRKKQETLDRSELYAVQTPQGFFLDEILEAYRKADAEGMNGTDDASIAEYSGRQVSIAEGDYANIKITTREDLPMSFRSGTGYDVHRLVTGRKLILGGVDIPYDLGLDGHSDADVLVHAIMDALLGAAALGDIGRHFPDTDPAYKGADSLKLLEHVGGLLSDAGYQICNIDAVIIAQRPKLAPFIGEMERNIASALGIENDQVNVKATTTEKLGFEGRQEGISSQAVCMICSS